MWGGGHLAWSAGKPAGAEVFGKGMESDQVGEVTSRTGIKSSVPQCPRKMEIRGPRL